ncbi:MAG TPA: hypothetical protein VKA30_13105 [Actinomycetota bacterium]|nr:hypothetical protein [Actinomycetota bacterium]
MSPRPASSIDVHIEELVLHGFESGDASAIGDGLRTELARLLADGPVPSKLGRPDHVERLDGGTVELDAGARPAAIGGRLAGTVWKGLAR